MKKLFLITLIVMIISSTAPAQITFTGDASADFSDETFWVMDANGEDDVGITSAMRNAGVLSGWDMYRVGFNYDRNNDILYVGIDYNGRICGDADGDGDPGDESYLTGNNDDNPDLGDGEVIALWLDTDNSGGPNGWDVICGVPQSADNTGYGVFEATGGWGNPNNSWGEPISASSASSLYANPSASAPDFECTIVNFSQLPGCDFDPLTDDVTFGVYAYSGSFDDGGVGYDKLLDSWATVDIDGPVSEDNLTHTYPQDLYVMEGIPLLVDDGDPPTLFGPPFSTNPPGWPWWRVSRWSSELQTYERYQETNWPIAVGGDPPDQNPGMGFWVVQDIEEPAEITVTGQFYEEGAVVTQSLQAPFSDGRRGLSQIANPFHFPVTWGDAWIQLADLSEDPMTIEEAAEDEIICRYAVSWDVYNLQYITNDVDATLGMWTGFWIEQYDLDNEYIIGFDYPAADNTSTTITTGGKAPELDDYESWSFSIGVIAGGINLYDCYNFLGISTETQDEFDQYDAQEFAPQVTDSGYVHLYFPHTDWTEHPGNYCFDFRNGPFTGDKYWDFKVRSWDYEGEVVLSWDGISKIEPQYGASLLDGTGSVIVPSMCDTSQFILTITPGEIQDYSIKIAGYGNSVEDTGNMPDGFSLSEAYPNPFNPATTLKMNLPVAAEVKAELFDVTGRQVALISDGLRSAGVQTISLDLSGQASGIYFVRVEAEKLGTEMRKIILIK